MGLTVVLDLQRGIACTIGGRSVGAALQAPRLNGLSVSRGRMALVPTEAAVSSAAAAPFQRSSQASRLGSWISATPVHRVAPFWLAILCFTWMRWRPFSSTDLSTTSAVWMVMSPESAGPR